MGVRDAVLASCDLLMLSIASTMDRDFDGWSLQYIANFPKDMKRTASGTITYII
jgi:hypothetical protein